MNFSLPLMFSSAWGYREDADHDISCGRGVIVSDLEYKQAWHHPDGATGQETPEEGSYFRLAVYFFMVGGAALMIAKLVDASLSPTRNATRIGLLGILAVSISLVGGYFGDRVLRYLRRTARRIRHPST